MTIDYTALATGVTDQITAALPQAMIIMSAILGITVGLKIFRRFAK